MVSASKYLLLLLALLIVFALLWLSHNITQAKQQHQLISHPERLALETGDSDDYPANVLFARAYYLTQQQETAEALALYNQLMHRPNEPLAQASRYNTGLIYLQQALDARHSGDKKVNSQFMPLLEVATQAFREVLTQNPQHYDARLALEQALAEIPEGSLNTAGWKENRTSIFSHVSGVSKGGP